MPPKSVLITGCSAGGIGSSLALELATRDEGRAYHIFAAVRNPSKATHFAGHSNITVVQIDVTSAESIAAAVGTLADSPNTRIQNGQDGEWALDVLVNNAGMGASGPLIETDIAETRRLFETNIVAVLAMTQAFKDPLIRAKGTIVNISSIGGCLKTPYIGTYSASKAAVTHLSETLRLELAPFGVRVITGMLGAIESNFHANDLGSGKALPASSRYKGVEKYVLDAAEGRIGPAKSDLHGFILQLVHDIERGASGQVWRGCMAGFTRFFHLLPQWVQDYALLPGSGLNTLSSR